MLMSIVLGGTVTAVAIRKETLKELKCSFIYHNWTKRDLIKLVVDILGFAVIRLIKTEYNERVVAPKNLVKDGIVIKGPVPIENSKNLKEFKALRKAERKRKLRLLKILIGKISGNLIESLLSFSLISYYLVVGTVSDHPDVPQPSPLVYLA